MIKSSISEKETLPEASAHGERSPKRGRVRRRWIIAGLAAALLVFVLVDLNAPRSASLREFDPDEVARLDTAMWRSYYAKERLRLFSQLSELLRDQYNLPFLRSNVVAYKAARAAFVFKDGRGRDDYNKALPYLVSYYSSIREVSDVPFNVDRAAGLELEWWIVHRERKKHAPGDLERALAELAAEIYQMPVEPFMDHARLRAEAMEIRDTKAEAGGVSEEDWSRIDELLHASWRSLWQAVQNPG
ncbi:MAG TPA: hypothetical protein VE262_08010 [Blastocatellia bacterium]|nr:hypothetical protein [Blastocatellia bacterium]